MNRGKLHNMGPHLHIVFVMPHEHRLWCAHSAWEFSDTQCEYKISVLCLQLSQWGC